MAEKQLETEVIHIGELIRKQKNFLLSGGAGSGKTYSLVQIINEVLTENPTSKVACITYTNAAVKEINERVNHQNLQVSTIHDFLWDNIKVFQKDLKKSLLALIKDKQSKIEGTEIINNVSYFKNNIQYKDYTRISDGIISHNEVLILANYMYKTYPLLCDILKDKYQFIFIDEYQDTHSQVIEIFIEHLKQSNKVNIIGFFGDAMQSIYDDGIGDLNKYLETQELFEVRKKQNRRNPKKVMDLANTLRDDGLSQEPSNDMLAPNMKEGKLKEGNVKFLYSLSDSLDLNSLKNGEDFSGWDFSDPKKTKELYLTHNLIAPSAGFSDLMEVYDKDPIIDLIGKLKTKIKEAQLELDDNLTFDEIVDLLQLTNKKKLRKDIITDNPDHNALYKQVKDLPYSIVRKFYITKDMLIDDKKLDPDDRDSRGTKRDPLIQHLFKIHSIVWLYRQRLYNDFIRKTEYSIISLEDKERVNKIVTQIENMRDSTIEQVIQYVDDQRFCIQDDSFKRFVKDNEYLYNRVKKVKYVEFINLYNYLEGHSPFSTQHKIKGAEFNNVLVILNNGGWNNFNFEYLFCDRTDKESIYKRTKKMFYVCCTRARENLCVFYQNPNADVLEQATQWFGAENVKEI
ncbi:DNA helicase-2/ATP-dependent DNA helicase PcrA [Paenibacillus phyllosphaerae]|uniref:DNA helicase-2/ATP-dependent DNA helicase PcrA n=1 Tax=Paenibacillus phyllosphaerae TaxID=274593 RepID=A0A7W5FRM5_9BACL|nr:UvrD-helicase domain-containing protein [Paenibacillus phyllosphaerae]MBB3114508.1 DNA helicase-2/ATP-dependent DNA helicase PcrA [Paenibacillus phyllosphaerae]